jgi:hypothetical protein
MFAQKKRVFISFAIEDSNIRDLVVGQMRNSRTPFEWLDYSVKEAWSQSWKSNCRTRIRGCDGMIGLISKHTPRADGQVWELQCAYEENIPVMLMYTGSDRPALLGFLSSKLINLWNWDNIDNFLNRI